MFGIHKRTLKYFAGITNTFKPILVFSFPCGYSIDFNTLKNVFKNTITKQHKYYIHSSQQQFIFFFNLHLSANSWSFRLKYITDQIGTYFENFKILVILAKLDMDG